MMTDAATEDPRDEAVELSAGEVESGAAAAGGATEAAGDIEGGSAEAGHDGADAGAGARGGNGKGDSERRSGRRRSALGALGALAVMAAMAAGAVLIYWAFDDDDARSTTDYYTVRGLADDGAGWFASSAHGAAGEASGPWPRGGGCKFDEPDADGRFGGWPCNGGKRPSDSDATGESDRSKGGEKGGEKGGGGLAGDSAWKDCSVVARLPRQVLWACPRAGFDTEGDRLRFDGDDRRGRWSDGWRGRGSRDSDGARGDRFDGGEPFAGEMWGIPGPGWSGGALTPFGLGDFLWAQPPGANGGWAPWAPGPAHPFGWGPGGGGGWFNYAPFADGAPAWPSPWLSPDGGVEVLPPADGRWLDGGPSSHEGRADGFGLGLGGLDFLVGWILELLSDPEALSGLLDGLGGMVLGDDGPLADLFDLDGLFGGLPDTEGDVEGLFDPDGPLADFFDPDGPLADLFDPDGPLADLFDPDGPLGDVRAGATVEGGPASARSSA